jgi:hypothetical protein
MTRWILRSWWIANAVTAVFLLCSASGEHAAHRHLLGALAVINATIGFVGTAIVGRLELILVAVGGSMRPESPPQ